MNRCAGVSSTHLIWNTAGPGRAARKLAAVAAAGTAAALLAAGCSSGMPSGQGSAGSGISPARAITLASQQAKRATSFSSSLSIKMSGIASGAIAGTLEMRTRPLLFDAAFRTMNVGGQSLAGGIEEILTGHTLYLKVPALARQLGKPWVKFSFAQFRNGTGMSLAQIIQQAQQNNPLVQMQMLAGARNVRVVGHQVIDGVPTTHYTGTYTAAAALARLPSSLRATEKKGLQALGVTSVRFSVWIDGQHQARKIVAYETGVSEHATVTLTVTGINQPITITLPPASQVVTIPASALKGGGL
jgi:LppX_LprAFG lipoprotein